MKHSEALQKENIHCLFRSTLFCQQSDYGIPLQFDFQHVLHSAVFEFDPSPGEREASVQSRPCFCGFSVRVL